MRRQITAAGWCGRGETGLLSNRELGQWWEGLCMGAAKRKLELD